MPERSFHTPSFSFPLIQSLSSFSISISISNSNEPNPHPSHPLKYLNHESVVKRKPQKKDRSILRTNHTSRVAIQYVNLNLNLTPRGFCLFACVCVCVCVWGMGYTDQPTDLPTQVLATLVVTLEWEWKWKRKNARLKSTGYGTYPLSKMVSICSFIHLLRRRK